MELDNYDRRTLERLLSYGVRDNNGCLIFTGTLDKDGYGKVGYKGKHLRVHRLIMYLKQGFDLNSELLILHKNDICRSKACFDDIHLYIGTAKKNTEDAIELHGNFNSWGGRNNLKKTNCGVCGLPLEGGNLLKVGRRRVCINCKRKREREYLRNKKENQKQEKENRTKS